MSKAEFVYIPFNQIGYCYPISNAIYLKTSYFFLKIQSYFAENRMSLSHISQKICNVVSWFYSTFFMCVSYAIWLYDIIAIYMILNIQIWNSFFWRQKKNTFYIAFQELFNLLTIYSFLNCKHEMTSFLIAGRVGFDF